MLIRKGRIVRIDDSTTSDRVAPVSRSSPSRPGPRARRVDRAIVEAASEAQRRIEQAEARAQAIVRAAEERVRAESEAVAQRARDAAAAEFAAAWLKLEARRATEEERNFQSCIELARLLAERLLGESLRLDRTTIVALARQALTNVRGARRILLRAHPDDAAVLRLHEVSPRLEEMAMVVEDDPALERGSVVVESDVGKLDARLQLQLDRLVEVVRGGAGGSKSHGGA